MSKDVVIAMLGSGAFFAFIQWAITFIDDKFVKAKKKKDKEAAMEERQISMDRKMTRIQLLLLIANYSDRIDEIMEVAYTYFVKLNGDWYAHDIFDEWLEKHNIHKPDWYK